jgi:hypothetical protein
MSSGYATKGFAYFVRLDDSVDLDLADKILEQADREVAGNQQLAEDLRHLKHGGRIVPFFSKANYTDVELYGKVSKGYGRTPEGQKLGGLMRLREKASTKYGTSVKGGNLRRSVVVSTTKEGQRTLKIMVTWKTHYLRHFVARGSVRHSGTSPTFWVKIQEKGKVARYLRNETATIARHAGVNPKHLHVLLAGIIEG